MSATICLYKYNLEANRIMEKYINEEMSNKGNFDYFDITYRNTLLKPQKSYTYKKMLNRWKNRIEYKKFYYNRNVIPVECIGYYSNHDFELKNKWFRRTAWLHVIDTKKGLKNWMKKYVKSSDWTNFTDKVINIFDEGSMFLEVSY